RLGANLHTGALYGTGSQSGCHANPFGTLTAIGAGSGPRQWLVALALAPLPRRAGKLQNRARSCRSGLAKKIHSSWPPFGADYALPSVRAPGKRVSHDRAMPIREVDLPRGG